jgi:CubicO group peptidase (beta-lactamase class C family)
MELIHSAATDPASIGFWPGRLAQIDGSYQAQIDAGALPSAVVAIARNGTLAYMRAFGHQDRDRKIRMPSDGIFWIALMTKPVTGVAAMMLVEQGKLDLDAPVSRYLPDLEGMQVATEETDAATGEPKFALAPQRRLMTVRDLLRHTSSLIYPPQFSSTRIHRLYGEKVVFTRDTTLTDFMPVSATYRLRTSRVRFGNTAGALTFRPARPNGPPMACAGPAVRGESIQDYCAQ